MRNKKLIQVFEHETLSSQPGRRGFDKRFTTTHFETLVKYNEENDNRFFTPIYRGIKFKQYVGVIQVGDLVIEILPKADRGNDKNKWRGVLIDMLKICRKIPLEANSDADLNLRHTSLMDIYLRIFLEEVDKIIHQGLVKKYRWQSENQLALRGSLEFSKHLQHNLIHKERFFVKHQIYDTNHLLHQILNEALTIVPRISTSSDIVANAVNQSLYFSKTQKLSIRQETFSKIIYNRKTAHYQPAIELARLILLNFSPDIQKGKHPMLAILFDMNRLWEEYLYRLLRKEKDIKVSFQNRKLFWESRGVRPDIVIEKDNAFFVLDAKWKVLHHSMPSDSDLKQMYVYHRYWNTENTFLIYPNVYDLEDRKGNFHTPSKNLQCQILFGDVLDETGKLNKNLGKHILSKCNI